MHTFAATKVTRFSASLSFDQKSLSFEENFGNLGKFYPFFVEFWVEIFRFWHFCLSFVRILLEFCQKFLEFCQNFPWVLPKIPWVLVNPCKKNPCMMGQRINFEFLLHKPVIMIKSINQAWLKIFYCKVIAVNMVIHYKFIRDNA